MLLVSIIAIIGITGIAYGMLNKNYKKVKVIYQIREPLYDNKRKELIKVIYEIELTNLYIKKYYYRKDGSYEIE